MIINEEIGNLFELPKSKYVFAHCIATDLKWGAGIAPVMMSQFNAGDKWRKYSNCNNYNVGDIGVDVSDYGIMINLFTKSSTWSKPTYESITRCLFKLCDWMVDNDKKYLAIPKIGCGLDRLSWHIVKKIISDVFNDTDIEIEVRFIK